MCRRYAIRRPPPLTRTIVSAPQPFGIPGKRLRTEPTTQARSPPCLGAVLTTSGIVESVAGAAGL
jgi:hypothetical protein